MANIENLKAFDPFADAAKGDDESVQDGLVHVRIQQRNGRKTLASVQVDLLCGFDKLWLLYAGPFVRV